MQAENKTRGFWYMLLTVGIILLALAGYGGYVLYPRFNLPNVTGAGLFLLATMAGIASFFSPCSFPLLTTLLARSIRGRDNNQENNENTKVGRALQYGAALAVGAALFLLLIGAGIALGGGALFKQVTFTSTAGRILRLVVGIILLILGLVQTDRLTLPFGRVADLAFPLQKAQARVRRQYPTAGFGLFGFGYILAGFG